MTASYKEAFLTVSVNRRKGVRLGGEFSRVLINGWAYLDRFIAYVAGGTLRLHKFYRGDDERASHIHPWWFITFPFTSYREDVYDKGRFVETRVVKAWRFHYRPRSFEHMVLGRADFKQKPFWTFVISGYAHEDWGFYPEPGKFVPYKQWKPSADQR